MMNPKRAYQEAAVRGASPVRLTVLLYIRSSRTWGAPIKHSTNVESIFARKK